MKNDYSINGDEVTICLKNKKGDVLETKIDLSDLDRANEYQGTWFAMWSPLGKCYYVLGNKRKPDGRKTTIYLHRWIMVTLKKTEYVDHINHSTLDNRRSKNLRVVTESQNSLNRKGAQSNSKSGIRGVFWHNRDQRWYAKICVKGKEIHIGRFMNKDDAETAVVEARRKYAPHLFETGLEVIGQ